MTTPHASVHPHTWLITAGRDLSPGSPLNTPLVPASNFILGAGRAYARDDGTPTWDALESIMAGLEGGRAVAFASGIGAIAAIFDQLPSAAHVLIPTDCYPGVVALAKRGVTQRAWTLDRVAAADTATWLRHAPRADLLWLESPSNPLLEVSDLPTICAAPRKPGAICAIDNTVATPLNQQPLALGADIVIHSVTKHIGGHSDLLGGVAITKSDHLHKALIHARELSGATPGVLESFLASRGARTLALRLATSQASAMHIAARLEASPTVERVRYPGLASHPQHDLAARTLRGFGSLITFDVRGGAAAADRVCQSLTIVRHATSLGAVESTIERRAAVPGQEHLPPGLLRLSVGCEHVEDLWRDLDRALNIRAK